MVGVGLGGTGLEAMIRDPVNLDTESLGQGPNSGREVGPR
jgi:hypothetical protein